MAATPPKRRLRDRHLGRREGLGRRGGAEHEGAAVETPFVSVVKFPVAEIQLACDTLSVLPDNGAVGFVPDQAEFRDPAAARKVLGGFASFLRENPAATVLVKGYIAHYGSGDLSQHRADRVKQELAAQGATNAITAKGMGWGPYPSVSTPPDPRYDQKNRQVTRSVAADRDGGLCYGTPSPCGATISRAGSPGRARRGLEPARSWFCWFGSGCQCRRVSRPSASSCSLERVVQVANLGVGGEWCLRLRALVAPADVVAEGGVLLGVAAVVGAVEGEVPHCGELGLVG